MQHEKIAGHKYSCKQLFRHFELRQARSIGGSALRYMAKRSTMKSAFQGRGEEVILYNLLHGEEKIVFGDTVYQGVEKRGGIGTARCLGKSQCARANVASCPTIRWVGCLRS